MKAASEAIIRELKCSCGWQGEYVDEFYEDILRAGFNRCQPGSRLLC